MTSSNKRWGKTKIRTKNIKMGRLQLPLRPSPVLGTPASPTETSAGTGKQGMPPWPRQSLKQLQGRWQRLMSNIRLFLMTEVQLQLQPALRLLQEQMVSRLSTPLTGPRTRLSTRDGNCGQRRLDSPLMPWNVTQKRLRFPTSIIGSMEREWDILSHGKTVKPSFTSLSMMDYKNIKKKASTLQKI